jgi:hypothetical protein
MKSDRKIEENVVFVSQMIEAKGHLNTSAFMSRGHIGTDEI